MNLTTRRLSTAVSASAVALALFTAGPAFAGEPGTDGTPAPPPAASAPSDTPSADAPSEAPAKDTTTPGPVTAPVAATGTTCLVFNNGLDAASAATGGQIMCDEIRGQGVALSSAGTPSANAYRVHFDRLGSKLIVRVTYEAPLGTVRRSRRITVSGVEEVPVAAPRLARAIVQDEALDASQRVDNLVSEETRKYEKKPGEFLWGVGIVGVSAPTENRWMSPGLEFMGYYETPQYGFGVSLRASFGSNGDSLQTASGGLGGRYFLSQGDTSLFVGGGLAISYAQVSAVNAESDLEGSGLGAFAEGGVEMMRLHSSRMILGLRADAPFYSVKDNGYDYEGAPTKQHPRWVMPVSISATYAW
ncbi:MAG: hypothetical protein IPI67_10390 [Myxococcales bacterium]|nr:hypothetical protein [Myxococcales bacterium]